MNDFGDRLRLHVEALTPEQPAPFRDVLRRRDRRQRRRMTIATVGTAIATVAAVVLGTQLPGPGPDPAPSSGATATSSPSASDPQREELTYEWSEEPSPVVLRLADRDLELKPWSYCWSGPNDRKGISPGICSDGYVQSHRLDRVGSPAFVEFWFGVNDWRFEATYTALGVDCPRQHTVQATRTDDQMFRLDPAGLAGRYRVDLFGRGRHGSVSTSFLWTTPDDGPIDQPAAYIALVSGDQDELIA